MKSGPRLFEKQNPVPPPGPMTVSAISRPAGTYSQAKVTNQKSTSSTTPPSKVSIAELEEGQSEKHKKSASGASVPKTSLPTIVMRADPSSLKEPLAGVTESVTPPSNGKVYSKGGRIVWDEGASISNEGSQKSQGTPSPDSNNFNSSFDEAVYETSETASSGISLSGSKATYDENATVNPLAGTQSSGTLSLSPNNDSFQSPGFAFGSSATTMGSSGQMGGAGKGSGFSDDFFDDLGSSEGGEAKEGQNKRKKKRTSQSGDNSENLTQGASQIRVAQPAY